MKYLFKFTVVILLFLSQFNSQFLSSNNETKSLSTSQTTIPGGVSKPSSPTKNDKLLLERALKEYKNNPEVKKILTIGYTVLNVTVQVVSGLKYEFLIKINNSNDEFYIISFVVLSNKLYNFQVSKVVDS